MTMRQAIKAATDELTAAGVGSARVDAELLAEHIAAVPRGLLALSTPGAAFLNRYRQLIALRAQRVPLQHLTGTASFGPVTVQVGPGVFIPRPETEALLEWASIQPLPAQAVIVDLCTGSGALALALAARHPGARVIAVDDSEQALDYARRNVGDTGIELVRADVTAPDLLADLDAPVDLLVANPPYIPAGAQLEPEVAQHDPEHALFGGVDGMAVIGPIVDAATRLLRPGGYCAVEHDDTTSGQTVELFHRARCFDNVTARHDWTGRARFVTARRGG
ncbi:peptide chain release factor N(5)-glutamine methyltransferase [Mycobacterium sp. SMC-4]|uniref:peptide chain release factor N(5)-glutamine methyltransferase n=1 Tax=Mycobacterium sp. SMC-4 TaxID=2857059 RepID=UPI0021B400A7|nr:peptide chain release factor N(5)-glutamine methyltransferase [Mycobacterium sp. SMC-4]UXA16726.1 peptide chain release factor N(5)-glutamine methyltransferase [Mycobacterium sp. SMC-4]